MFQGLPDPNTLTLLNTEVKYEIALIGNIWMPSIICASVRTYNRDTFSLWSEQPDWNDPKAELEAIEEYLNTDTGDFQNLIDWHCLKQTEYVYSAPNGDIVRTIYEEVIKQWNSKENELTYLECQGEV